VDAAASVTASAAGPDLHKQILFSGKLIVISRKKVAKIFWKNRNRRTHRWQSKKKRARKSRDRRLCIEFHRILHSLVSIHVRGRRFFRRVSNYSPELVGDLSDATKCRRP
jgi:hypothetical protein